MQTKVEQTETLMPVEGTRDTVFAKYDHFPSQRLDTSRSRILTGT